MEGEMLYGVNEWAFFPFLLGLLVLATEIGFQLGHRVRSNFDEAARPHISTVQAAVLGLLALLLGFTFSASMSRFDTRKQLVVDESNAIGTGFLRTQMLPEPSKTEASDLLRRYVDVRLLFYRAGIDQKKLREAKDNSERLHNELWSRAVALGEKNPSMVPSGLYSQSLNQIIDLHTKRIEAMNNHVPEAIFLFLYLISVVSMGLIGYGAGIGGRRNFISNLWASIFLASVILLVVDIDRPRRGLIKVSQQSMIDLQKSLKKSGP